MASPAQWTWVWANSGGWWWTGKPGVLQSMGSQRVRHYWATKLTAATAAKSLQLCPTLCDPIDGSPPGTPVPGILQVRTLEWGPWLSFWFLLSFSFMSGSSFIGLSRHCWSFYLWCEQLSKLHIFFLLFKSLIFLNGGKLLYSIVLVSAIQQPELVIIIYIPSLWSLPPWPPYPHPTPLGHHRVPGGAPCAA